MDELHELTAAYALDALDTDDARAYEAHLAECPRCREELSALSDTATALAYAAGEATPPEALRGRILDAARAERTNVVPLRSRRRPTLRALTAIAACLVVGLGIWNLTLQRRLDHRTAVAQVLGDPRAERVSLPKAAGELLVSKHGVVLIANVTRAPAGKTYEAWMIPKGGSAADAVPAGTFTHAGPVLLHGTPASGVTMAVTVEKRGGADHPTSAPVVSATLD